MKIMIRTGSQMEKRRQGDLYTGSQESRPLARSWGDVRVPLERALELGALLRRRPRVDRHLDAKIRNPGGVHV